MNKMADVWGAFGFLIWDGLEPRSREAPSQVSGKQLLYHYAFFRYYFGIKILTVMISL